MQKYRLFLKRQRKSLFFFIIPEVPVFPEGPEVPVIPKSPEVPVIPESPRRAARGVSRPESIPRVSGVFLCCLAVND